MFYKQNIGVKISRRKHLMKTWHILRIKSLVTYKWRRWVRAKRHFSLRAPFNPILLRIGSLFPFHYLTVLITLTFISDYLRALDNVTYSLQWPNTGWGKNRTLLPNVYLGDFSIVIAYYCWTRNWFLSKCLVI